MEEGLEPPPKKKKNGVTGKKDDGLEISLGFQQLSKELALIRKEVKELVDLKKKSSEKEVDETDEWLKRSSVKATRYVPIPIQRVRPSAREFFDVREVIPNRL